MRVLDNLKAKVSLTEPVSMAGSLKYITHSFAALSVISSLRQWILVGMFIDLRKRLLEPFLCLFLIYELWVQKSAWCSSWCSGFQR